MVIQLSCLSSDKGVIIMDCDCEQISEETMKMTQFRALAAVSMIKLSHQVPGVDSPLM